MRSTLFLLFVALAVATDRLIEFVGEDSGDCTSSPCATFVYALGQSSDGDAIVFGQGIFTQDVAASVGTEVSIRGQVRSKWVGVIISRLC